MANYVKLFFLTILLLTSCRSAKEVLYFQDIQTQHEQLLEKNYEVTIHTDDLLSIVVNSRSPELAVPFNMPLVSYTLSETYAQKPILGYLVDHDGTIDFPVLGPLQVEGLSRMQVTEMIKKRIIEGHYIKDPMITVQFQNFRVSVMGEVSRPGNFTISGDRITLFEALSLAGDLTIYGRRDRVRIIREVEGKRTLAYVDLRYSSIFNSPYYYLQQNDIVYVEPNKTKAHMSGVNQNNNIGVWFSAISILVSLASVFVNLAN